MILAGDIGGTKVQLSLLKSQKGTARRLRSQRFESRRYPSLEAVLVDFLGPRPPRIARACIGVAGPVLDGRCETPNLPWSLDERAMKRLLRTSKVRLLNDLESMAYGVLALGHKDLVVLHPGKRRRGFAAVIAAGTGLGESCLLWDGSRYHPQATESGHADFAPRDDLEWGLAGSLRREHGHVSWERVLSGAGLAAAYRHLVASGAAPAAPAVEEQMRGEDPAAVVSRHALAGTDEGCRRALDLFASLYGAQAGNLALEVLATGGVYLAGGIAPRIVERLREGGFLRSFRDKGRFAGLLERIPVRVIVSPRVALLGAAAVGAGLTEGGGR